MNLTMTMAQQTREDNKRLSSFSKQWSQGETWLVLYPLTTTPEGQLDIVTAAQWGYAVNQIKEFNLKRAFIPTNAEIENGQPKKLTILHRFSRMARLFLEGEHEANLRKVEENSSLTQSMKNQKLKQIEDEFAKKSPVISSLRYSICTECCMVKIDNSTGAPDITTAVVASQELSNGKVSALRAALQAIKLDNTFDRLFDPRTMPDASLEELEEARLNIIANAKANMKYLPVIYAFGCQKDKKEAGRVDPSYQAYANTPAVVYPDLWNKILPTLAAMATTTEQIQKRNTNYASVDDADILRCISFYTASNADKLQEIKESETLSRLQKQADLLKTLEVKISNVDYENAEVIEDAEIPHIETTSKTEDIALPPVTEEDAVTSDEILKAISENENEELLGALEVNDLPL